MVPPLPTVVITTMAMRAERMHHYLFHEVRNNWFFYTDLQQQQLTALGWAPPRPALDANGNALLSNNSGEDFLYMHRQMIARVNELLAQAGSPDYPKIVGWNPIPAPGDADYPVPPVWDPSVQDVKSDDFYTSRIVPWEHQYTDPNTLSQWTLGELGSRLEFSIHNAMHMRWSSQPTMIRPDADPTDPDATIPTAFDDPSYDFLGDTYSSHVNYIFWKLHGWIDDRIEDWKAANGVTGELNWVGTWMGKMDMPPMPGMEPLLPGVHPGFAGIHTPEHLQNMEQASQVIAQAGVSRPRFLIDPSLLPEAGEVNKEKVTMTHQKNHLNLEFRLSGEGAEITYVTNDQDGKPHFTYKDAEFDRSYTGDEIRIQKSDLGALVTVTLRIVPDVGSDTVTLIVPRARVAQLAEPVETLVIKCHNSMTMVPQPGAAQSYQAVCLKGSVQSTVLR